ncbi:MAG: NAD(P)/FAD-dependent oxidoreductase, partial [Kiritimatiellae bacterium]|nr:NAD(P)/FAD-dependent oxidoreductase [Kiritimatiellia bacterium]
METFDVVVIGGGPGGYPAAIRAAQLGARVALVEKELLGGTCLNWGCIPTKTLIAAADTYHRIAHLAQEGGIRVENATLEYSTLAAKKDEIVAGLRRGVDQLLKANDVRVYNGHASFLSRNKIRIENPQGETILQAGATIIATGAASHIPAAIPQSDRVLDSRAFLNLHTLPNRILILGGGVIGCEFACMAAKLGSEVTIIELLEDILPVGIDSDVRTELRRSMETELGIRILTGGSLENVRCDQSGLSARFRELELTADILLVSTGRRPLT